jgi:hypothetical protein
MEGLISTICREKPKGAINEGDLDTAEFMIAPFGFSRQKEA